MRILLTILLIGSCAIASTMTLSKESKKQISDQSLTAIEDKRSTTSQQKNIRPDAVSLMPPGTSVRWYGFYDPFTGAAVKDEMWTFDHGAMDPFEGWTTNDSTQNDFVAWRRITPGSWAGYGNIPPAPVIAGTASVWLGFFEDEAAHADFKAGLGYGNGWCQQLRTPGFVSGSGSATLSFDYFSDMELYFDSLHVFLEQGGYRTTIAGLSGTSGSPGSPLYFSQSISPTVSDTFNILFEFTSDEGVSDHDSLYATDLGPFCIDNVDLQGTSLVPVGPSPPYDFEGGWTGFVSSACEGVGAFAGVNDVTVYSLPPIDCGLTSNVFEVHNDFFQHPGYQEEMLQSPPLALPSTGGPLNIFADYDAYNDLEPMATTPWNFAWSYYPWICPVCGDSLWSIPKGMGNLYVGSMDPSCERYRSFASDTASGTSVWGAGKLVPDDADSLRFYLHVANWFDSVAHTPAPLFDNIRIGLSNQATILHVPSPSYMTIQAAIDAADEGDTVLVRGGVYTGTGNKDLHFTGQNIVLMSEDGPYATIIDCEGVGRGMEILAGQDTSTIVQGFTFKNGDGVGMDGGGVYLEYSPVRFFDCVFDSNSTGMSGGGVYVYGDPHFLGCRFTNNSAFDQGAGVAVMSGNPVFADCFFEKNAVVTTGGGVSVGGGGPLFFNCFIDSNTTNFDGGGVYINGGTPIFEGGRIHGNDAQLNGGGIFAISTGGVFIGCEIALNTAFQHGGGIMNYGDIQVNGCDILENYSTDEGGGVYIAAGDPSFNNCFILGNSTLADGGGAVVTGSSMAMFIGCTISDNEATLNAGGVFVYSATPTFIGCEISGNESWSVATWGGGIMATDGNFLECAIINNVSHADGGGISVPSGSPSFQDCWIAGNDAMSGGGAAITATATPDFSRCVITGNRGQWEGGGLSVEMGGPSLPDLTSCTIADNYAGGGGGGGVRVVNNLRTAFVIPMLQTIVWGNCSSGQGAQVYVTSSEPGAGVSFTCSDVDSSGMDTDANGVILYITDNIFENPWFCLQVECALAPITSGDYALRNASPCLASNSPCFQLIGALDEGCTATDIPKKEVVSLPTEYRLFQNVPNPFNPTTHIAFELPRPGRVVLRVYSATGHLIRTLTNEMLPRARHSVSWDGRDENGRLVASGVYFYRLMAPGFTETKKMILLR